MWERFDCRGDQREEEDMSDMSIKTIGTVIVVIGLASASVGGCAWVEEQLGLGEKAQVGAAGGAATGGLLAAAAGASPLGLAAGVVLGGIAGGAVGNYLDNNDREAALKAQQRAMENNRAGETTTWTDPSDGHSGTFTPTNTYTSADGKTCRDYQQTVTIDGKQETAIGTACKMADGTWRVHQV
jgi:surface antigen